MNPAYSIRLHQKYSTQRLIKREFEKNRNRRKIRAWHTYH